jgi:hypothetical protein
MDLIRRLIKSISPPRRSGIHSRVHRPLHRFVVDRINVGEFARDQLQKLAALLRREQRGGAADQLQLRVRQA